MFDIKENGKKVERALLVGAYTEQAAKFEAASLLGELEELPEGLQGLIADATARTAANTGIHFNVCTNYGGRRELVRASRRLAERVASGELSPGAIDEACFAAELHTAGDVDPDLLIRTSGEQRISNFLLWQLAYAELHITDVLWPDFDAAALEAALLDYQSRRRRFGGVDRQE
jgi:undecaprenyl diphosphate synthase